MSIESGVKPLRLALLGYYPIEGGPTGGVENVCYQLAALLARRPDLELHVVSPAPTLAESRMLEGERLRVHAVGCKGLLPTGLNHYLKLRRRFTQVLRQLAPDVAHAEVHTCGLWAVEAGIPTVFTVHGIYAREAALVRGPRRLLSLLHLHYFKKALRRAGFIISVSPYAQQELEPYTDARFIYIPNPVNPLLFELEPGCAEEARFLFVGSLIERKCLRELLEAFRIVHRDHPGARLRLVGKPVDPAYFRELTRFVAENGLEEAVWFAGPVSERDLLDEYERACAVVLMSRQETAPGSIGEAMAAGKAVVSNRICGIPYMVDEGTTGLLVEGGDVEGFAARMKQLLDDPSLCRELGRRGRQKALDEFHPEQVVEETVRAYRRVIGNGPST